MCLIANYSSLEKSIKQPVLVYGACSARHKLAKVLTASREFRVCKFRDNAKLAPI
jgi:hypothetical protein